MRQNGGPLTQQQLVTEVRRCLKAAGVNHSFFSGHSFRIGAATMAARAGVPSHLIKMLGRWESEAYLLYVRTPREELAQISTLLAQEVALEDPP